MRVLAEKPEGFVARTYLLYYSYIVNGLKVSSVVKSGYILGILGTTEFNLEVGVIWEVSWQYG